MQEDYARLQESWAEFKRGIWSEIGPPIERAMDWLDPKMAKAPVPSLPQWFVFVSPVHWIIWLWTGKRPVL